MTSSQQVASSQQAAPSQQVTQQKQAGRPQEVAKAKAAKLRAKHVRVAKNDSSHKPMQRKAVSVAKRERSRIERKADTHIRYLQGKRHRRA